MLTVMQQTSTDSVAANVRAELARRRVRPDDLATALGISRSALHRRLTGEVPFDVNQLQTVAGHLGVASAELLGEVSA
jgi:transcriptional regulator with XRE-family HTH domain